MMKLKYILIACILLLNKQQSYGHPPIVSESVQTPSEHIQSLKNGVLLIRLQTKTPSINALIAAGRTAQAEQIRTKQRHENLELVKALRAQFSFCPVYFFYSDDSDHIIAGDLDSVRFLNDELEFDPSIKPENINYYTAEMGLVAQNTDKKQLNLRESEEKDINSRNEAKYYGGANLRFHAFIIKDKNFNQLRKPFPYYVRTLNSFFLRKSVDEVIRSMNQKLHKFL